MKARTKFEKWVATSNEKLTAIGSKAVEWAVRNVLEHIAFRTSRQKCTCGDCGEKFDYKGKGKFVRCPHCGSRLEVKDTLKRKGETSAYFSTLETMDSLQVQRVFLLKAIYKKGQPMNVWHMEVCRLWLNTQGQTALTSRCRTLGHYMDSFNWGSPIELRNMNEVHGVISDTAVCPRYSVLPELDVTV